MSKSFGITVRPRLGIPSNGSLETRLLKYFKKLKYSSVCFEKHDAERHLHAQVWYDKETNKGDIMKTVRDRICKDEVSDWDNSQKKHAVKINICYNS